MEWDVRLNFTEPSGESDWVIFGEAPDANNGAPPDDYDTPSDGEFSEWVGPYNSGETASASHTWNREGETGGWTGNYEIKVKAKDENELESNWSDPLPVTMPRLYNEKAVDISNTVVYDEDTSHNLFSHRVGRSIGEFIDFILRIFERQNEKLFKSIKQQFYLNLKVNRIA